MKKPANTPPWLHRVKGLNEKVPQTKPDSMRIADLALSSGLIAFFSLSALAALYFWVSPPSGKNTECRNIEWVMQNAAECLANPQMWQRWDEISSIYGVESVKNPQTCPRFIKHAEKIQGYTTFLPSITSHLHLNSEDKFQDAVRAVYGTNFCNVAQSMGWAPHE